MEVAAATLELDARTLGSYRCHTEAKDENDEERGDGVKNHMDAKPYRSLGTEIAPCQDSDGEGEENCYAGESGWFIFASQLTIG